MNKIQENKIPDGWKIEKIENWIYKKWKVPKNIKESPVKWFINYLTPEYLRWNTILSEYVEKNSSVLSYDYDLLILWDWSNAWEIFKGKTWAISSTMVKLTINKIDKKFLFYFFKNSEHIIKTWTKWSGIPHADKDIINWINFIIPSSLKEQQKIAEILSTVDDAIEKTDALIKKYKKIKTGLMEDLFTKWIDLKTGKPHTKFKESELGKIPESWEVDSIWNTFSWIWSWTTPKADNPLYYNIWTINWLNTWDLTNWIISQCKKKVSKIAIEKFSSLKIYNKWALVIAMYGATIWKLWLLDIKACTNQACCVLYKSNNINIKYAFYYFAKNKDYLISLWSWAWQPNISQIIIKWFKIIFPNIKEQEAIADILEGADENIEREVEYKEKLEKIKRGLMEDLLSGKVRV